jgi:hypothetical protein
VKNKSSTGFNRTQRKTHQSREDKSWVIIHFNLRSNLLEDR